MLLNWYTNLNLSLFLLLILWRLRYNIKQPSDHDLISLFFSQFFGWISSRIVWFILCCLQGLPNLKEPSFLSSDGSLTIHVGKIWRSDNPLGIPIKLDSNPLMKKSIWVSQIQMFIASSFYLWVSQISIYFCSSFLVLWFWFLCYGVISIRVLMGFLVLCVLMSFLMISLARGWANSLRILPWKQEKMPLPSDSRITWYIQLVFFRRTTILRFNHNHFAREQVWTEMR